MLELALLGCSFALYAIWRYCKQRYDDVLFSGLQVICNFCWYFALAHPLNRYRETFGYPEVIVNAVAVLGMLACLTHLLLLTLIINKVLFLDQFFPNFSLYGRARS